METRKQHIKIIISCSLLLFMAGFSFLALAGEDRHAVVDQAIGGMEQGRRISGSATSGNHGYIFSNSSLPNTPSATGTAQAETGQASGIINTRVQAGPNGSEQATESGSSGTTTQEPSRTSSNPIVTVEAGTNPASGTPNAGVAVDTSGQLEDKQILDAGVVGSGTGSSGAEVGSATDITAQELVHEADITTAQEPAGTSGNPIVGVEAGTNPESGTPNVGVAIDTTGELEDKQILQTDLAAEGIALSEQVGSASDITGSTVVQGADVTTEPVESAIPIPSDLSAEVDTTGQTVGGVADIGAEADVSGISEGEDVTCDPVDGLTSTACGPLKP